ncbi:MAG: hypothetical protein HOE83_00040 [Alphaproteobacteria bacterium]|nr:hypothetical protein [Alphaproteobacteria bacterium]
MSDDILYADIETQSQIDLIKHGLMRYATDKTTHMISLAHAFNDEPVDFWWGKHLRPTDAPVLPFPTRVLDHIERGGIIVAHNADFERHLFDYVISEDYNFDAPAIDQWHCSMAISLANGYPAGLDAAAQAAGLPYQKNPAGTRLIQTYCAPGHLTEFLPGDAELMEAYNISDVEVMRALTKVCRDLSDDEWQEYFLTCKINQRGLPVDTEFADAALGYANEVADDANLNIATLTGGKMTKHTQRKSRDEWLFPKLLDYQIKLLEVYKKGVKKISLDYEHRQYLLACDDLDFDARSLLEYIDNAGSAVLRKYSVAHHQHVGGRVFNTFLWNGAGRTGRFSGKGLQPHNMRRDVFGDNEAEALIQDVMEQIELDKPATTMARLLRAMIYSKAGLYWVDWSAIEGRVAPWLANSLAGELKLDLYREGKDVYIVTAADMFDMMEDDVDSVLRQSGKIAELSLQFGGGAGALIGMAKNYGVTFDDDEAGSIVRKWRRANPWAEDIWSDYDKAITGAVRAPGVPFTVGRVTYCSDGDNFLWCELPSGRLLSYPKPLWEEYFTPWDEARVGATFQTHFKPPAGKPPLRNHARGALLFQNTVQAVAADLLREALVEADAEGLDIIGHVHDEVIGQGPVEDGELLNEIMCENPWWADGLPLATGGVSSGRRYGK